MFWLRNPGALAGKSVAAALEVDKGFACAIFKRSGLRKLRAEKVIARQVDDLCGRFNFAAV